MIIGVDPGKVGAYAFQCDEGMIASPIPLSGKEIDGRQLSMAFSQLMPCTVYIEKAQAMPGQGVASMFNYGKGFGLILGVCEALGIPYRLITPQAWKKVVLSGTAKDKDAAVNFVRRAYPGVNLTPGRKQKPHDGMADAVCIAEYGARLERERKAA